MIMIALVAGVTFLSKAQGGGGRPQQTPDQRVDRLKAAVTGINDDQAAKIKAVYTASAKSTDSLRAAPGFDRTTARPAMTAITTAANAKIRAILTADQQKQFDAIPPQGRGGRGNGGGGGGGGAPAGGN